MSTEALSRPPDVVRMLADEVRWQLVRSLARSDRRVRELVQIVGAPYNLVSYHLKQLKAHHIVNEHRSSRDGRDVYYSLDIDALRQSYAFSADSIHPAIQLSQHTDGLADGSRSKRARVLILCTHNSARSQMAEAILRSISNNSVDVFSAGSAPSRVNADAIAAMKRMHIDISGQHSKSMDEYLGQHFDYVITVCDSVREVCPIFPGAPERIHWSFPDPSEVEDSEERARAFGQTAMGLTTRLRHLLTLIEREGNPAE